MNATSVLDDLRSLPAFGHMPPEQLARLAQVMVRRTYTPGESIFLEDDPAAGIWFVVRGRVRIIKHSLQGRTQVLCITSAGKCFGGCPLFDARTNPANAQAVDDVCLLLLTHPIYQAMIHHDPELAVILLEVYHQRYAHLARLSEELGVWSIAMRINDCLLLYAEWEVVPPLVLLTHERLANLVGTVREVVTRHLDRLERAGTVQLKPGEIALLQPAALHTTCVGRRR
jgi:CRP-like cAMP-binding protein